MPEPLIHFIVPFFILIMLGLGIKKSFIISSLAIVPDLDVIFHIHRSMSHSIVFILAISIIIIIFLKLNRNKFPNIYKEVIIATFVVMSHPIMDMFTWYTPVLWPFFNKSIYIFTELTTNMNNIYALNLQFDIRFDNIVFAKTENTDGAIFTSQGVGVSIVLLVGLLSKYISIKARNTARNTVSLILLYINSKKRKI